MLLKLSNETLKVEIGDGDEVLHLHPAPEFLREGGDVLSTLCQ